MKINNCNYVAGKHSMGARKKKGGGGGDKYLNNYKPKEEKLELKAYSTFQS